MQTRPLIYQNGRYYIRKKEVFYSTEGPWFLPKTTARAELDKFLWGVWNKRGSKNQEIMRFCLESILRKSLSPNLDGRAIIGWLKGLIMSGRLKVTRVRERVGRPPTVDKSEDVAPEAVAIAVTKPQKYELVELVEVIKINGTLGTVGGAAWESGKLPQHRERNDKDVSGAYKQFINLKRKIDGVDTPEYGRYIDLRARIEWKSGDLKKSLGGRRIIWKVIVKKHATEGNPGRPAKLKLEREKFGLKGKNNVKRAVSKTDHDGWTQVRFFFSQYSGDQFTITAEVDTSDKKAIPGKVYDAGPYVVWRKFWYQFTHLKSATVPSEQGAIDAFHEVAADMQKADVVEIEEADLLHPDTWLYEKWLLTTNSSETSKSLIVGNHNVKWFSKKIIKKANEYPKTNIILCDEQWDHQGVSRLVRQQATSRKEEVEVNIQASNGAVIKPELRGKNLVVVGYWTLSKGARDLYDNILPKTSAEFRGGFPPRPPKPWSGQLTDDDIEIVMPRTSLKKVMVTLPGTCPDPSKYVVMVVLKVRYATYWQGWCLGRDSVVVIDPLHFPNTIAHEIGHGFGQVPHKRHSISLRKHSKQYDEKDGHGGLGSHCHFDATLEAPTKEYPKGEYSGGTCVMLDSASTSCKGEFCQVCEPHLRLERLNRLG